MNAEVFVVSWLVIAVGGTIWLVRRQYRSPDRYRRVPISTVLAMYVFWPIQLIFCPILFYNQFDCWVTLCVWLVSSYVYVSFRLWVPLVWHVSPIIALLIAYVWMISGDLRSNFELGASTFTAFFGGALVSLPTFAAGWFSSNFSLRKLRFSIGRLVAATTIVAVICFNFAFFTPVLGLMVLAFENAAVAVGTTLSGQRKVRNWSLVVVCLILTTLLFLPWNSPPAGHVIPFPWPFGVAVFAAEMITMLAWLSESDSPSCETNQEECNCEGGIGQNVNSTRLDLTSVVDPN